MVYCVQHTDLQKNPIRTWKYLDPIATSFLNRIFAKAIVLHLTVYIYAEMQTKQADPYMHIGSVEFPRNRIKSKAHML